MTAQPIAVQTMVAQTPVIRLLPSFLIDQIAAGEVITGPAAALKELLDNSLDAGASRITVRLENAGLALLEVIDNGCGIPKDSLAQALQRHATSKLPEDNLMNLQTLGFRGEALAAMAAVAELTLISRTSDQDLGFSITHDEALIPMKANIGTTVRLQTLFGRTPARLKFLKSPRSYRIAIKQVLVRYAMAFPSVTFEAREDDKPFFTAMACEAPSVAARKDRVHARLKQLWLGIPDDHLHWLESATETGYRLHGFMASPLYHYATGAVGVHVVNGRPLRDALVQHALRAAFGDAIPHGRFPFAVLFLEVPTDRCDMNVHPAKEEVRFAEPRFLRDWLVALLKKPLDEGFGHKSSTRTLEQLLTKQHALEPSASSFSYVQAPGTNAASKVAEDAPFTYRAETAPPPEPCQPIAPILPLHTAPDTDVSPEETRTEETGPLGTALAQLHNSYILAQSEGGLVLVDQHAAHERLNFETFKKHFSTHAAEPLIVPTPVILPPALAAPLIEALPTLKDKGLHIEAQGGGTFLVYALPTLLKTVDQQALLADLAESLQNEAENDEESDHAAQALERRVNDALGNHACKNSLKAGQRLSLGAMNHLLRAIEKTPQAGQCNHGRPTYVVLKRGDIDRLFERHS